jgi:tetratricopeptide (TPR) repeat protein
MIELLLAAERMLADGDLDHAERLFSQVAEADPRNAIAVVGLAEVASARGDGAGAVATARRALEIDPENAAARRMIDRLEAVAPEPAVQAAAPPEAAAEAEAAAEVSIAAAPEPAAAAQPEPEPEAAPEGRTEPEPEPLPPLAPVRRSWLDRLIGFFRRR